jgi:hypothetical protein
VGPLEKDKRRKISLITDSPITTFLIISDTLKLTKRINHYDLETKEIDDKTPNVNYDSNQKTILKLLKDLAEKEAKTLRTT